MTPVAQPPSRDEKDVSIETLRGIAILLVVAFHAAGGLGQQEVELNYFSYSFNLVRMPMFAVISGFVYALRPVRTHALAEFTRGKARRILLPFFVVTTLTMGLYLVVPGTHRTVALTDVVYAYVRGDLHLWYLLSIFLIFIYVAALDLLGWTRSLVPWTICVAVAALASFFLPKWPLFGFGGSVYLLPYFLFGCGLARFKEVLYHRRLLVVVGVLAFASVLIHQLVWFRLLETDVSKVSSLGLCLGISINWLLFGVRKPVGWLAAIGVYAYSIFLYHLLGISLSNRVAGLIGIAEIEPVLFATRVAAGLMAGVVVERVCRQIPTLGSVALGFRRPRCKLTKL